MPQLTRRARRVTLIVHVVVSVGWLGLSLCLLVLAVAGARGTEETAGAAHRSMRLLTDWPLPPLIGLTLLTGVVLSLGTRWGLAHHRWVWVKFWVSVGAATASLLALRPEVNAAAAAVAAGEPVADPGALIAPPLVSSGLYVFLTALSVLKPWGLTRRGRRVRAARALRRGGSPPKNGRPPAGASATLGG
ncbi:hypothetical protein SAMN06297387_112149 [Streptomyces zhaozhouensis]|uniref:DUF2269 domain-containing protein n=1 Tax=Streptomyces zhaozhouensis TaxID=1300267 RepID=A0A286DYT5_9ACTN|nr:DUF2269 domain-containing protein [Streptomyces zhaozhouensis]SOD63790.1 hypothetical protein SAMN06297387_112149 [Streptomyces zhaozhouensis]